MPKFQVLRRQEANAAPAVRLLHVPSLTDSDGEPRIALEVRPGPGAVSRRPVLTLFASMAAALVAKRELEAGR